MTTKIQIDTTHCICCGRCVAVCPSLIFQLESKLDAVTLHKEENCIGCGHCVSACPTGAVIHTQFPTERIHTAEYASLPTPEQVLHLCAIRRSNRVLLPKPVPEEALRQIVAAADLAPTATNARELGFVVVTDPALLRGVRDYTIDVFDKVVQRLTNPLIKPWLSRLKPDIYRYVPVFKHMKRDCAEGHDRILRGATALLVIHAPQDSRFGEIDANLAYQNASLMAETLGISQIYMGFVLSALKQDKHPTLARMLGLKGRKICAVMALGIPQFRYPNYIDREPAEVIRR